MDRPRGGKVHWADRPSSVPRGPSVLTSESLKRLWRRHLWSLRQQERWVGLGVGTGYLGSAHWCVVLGSLASAAALSGPFSHPRGKPFSPLSFPRLGMLWLKSDSGCAIAAAVLAPLLCSSLLGCGLKNGFPKTCPNCDAS